MLMGKGFIYSMLRYCILYYYYCKTNIFYKLLANENCIDRLRPKLFRFLNLVFTIACQI